MLRYLHVTAILPDELAGQDALVSPYLLVWPALGCWSWASHLMPGLGLHVPRAVYPSRGANCLACPGVAYV